MTMFRELRLLRPAVVFFCVAAAGCGQPSSSQLPPSAGSPETAAMSITVTSAEFAANGMIPEKYTGNGDDASPPLSWSNVPEGTKEFALICNDPDAKSPEPWVHWVLYKIPGDCTSLPEAVPIVETLTDDLAGAVQGENSFGLIGYGGPMPPQGEEHHYHFRLYALDAELDLEPGLTKDALLEAMSGRVLAAGELVGVYEQK